MVQAPAAEVGVKEGLRCTMFGREAGPQVGPGGEERLLHADRVGKQGAVRHPEAR